MFNPHLNQNEVKQSETTWFKYTLSCFLLLTMVIWIGQSGFCGVDSATAPHARYVPRGDLRWRAGSGHRRRRELLGAPAGDSA